MIQSIYLFVGLLAVAASAVSINDRLPIDAKVAASAAAFVLWVIWAFSSYNVEVVTDGGTVISHSYEMLALVGLAAGGIMVAYAVWNIMAMFGMDPQRLLGVRL